MNYRYRTKDQAAGERLLPREVQLAHELSDDLLYELMLDDINGECDKVEQN